MTPTRARRLRSIAGAVLSGAVAFAVMAADRHERWAFVLAGVAILAAVTALLDSFGMFDGPDDVIGASTMVADLARPLAWAAGALVATGGALDLACRGWLGRVPAALVVPSAFLGLVASVHRVRRALDPCPEGGARPLLLRHGAWVIAVGTLLYLPALGAFSLIDPWETHYGEVAREMLARDDWISTWSPQVGWFWSKPVLDMWMQALAMGALGVGFLPGQMMSPGGIGPAPRPEWAVRLPSFALALLTLYVSYRVVALTCGRRAGLFAALVLATTTQFFFMAHQSITDMPFVASLSISLLLLFAALEIDPEAVAPTYDVRCGQRRLRFGAHALVLGVVVMTVIPQILYVASRNVELQWAATPHGFRPHLDEFWSGSKGNCGLPGNAACTHELPAHPALQPMAQAAAFLALLGAVLFMSRGERRVRRLCMLGAWYFAGVAVLAKGVGGVALPALVGMSYIAAKAKWKDLPSLGIPTGLAIVAVVAGPWYVAMYARHGHPFIDELFFQHMYKRALDHVHDTNVGDDVSFRYYVWQLGYALFPWTGLVPTALVGWKSNGDIDPRDATATFFGIWFVLAFGLFTAMPTKFHHYIFPAVPPAAMMTGIWLDRLMGKRASRFDGGETDAGPDERARDHESRMIGCAGICAAIVVALVGRDLTSDGDTRGESRLIGLFTYNYHRVWPDSLDFRVPLLAITAFFAAVAMALVVRRARRHAAMLFVAGAITYAAWGLDAYLPRCAPHWGQREIFEAYMRKRAGGAEPIIAYRMNWLGEYFYSGNRIPAFGVAVSQGASIARYVEGQIARGATTFFFVTEAWSVTALKNDLERMPRSFDVVTDAKLNNKFVLVRATFESAKQGG